MENHYNCIYMYINKTNGHKYIGQTKNFKKRHNEHINNSHNKKAKDYNLCFHRAIRKYGEGNFEIIILKENIRTQCLLNLYECYYIEKYNCLSRENYNIASGGYNGNSFAGKTDEEMEEIRRKMSENHADFKGEKHHLYGKKWSDETRDKICNVWKNRTIEELNEWKQKISESHKGKQLSEEHKQRISDCRKIKIDQYTKDGIFIKTWNSIKEAKESLGIGSGISECCIYYELGEKEWWNKYNKYPRKSIGGFIWKYHH